MQKIINNNIEEQRVGFDNAKLLKEKGFEVPTDRYYRSDGVLVSKFEDSLGCEREYQFNSDDFLDNWNKPKWVIGKDGGMCFGCKLDNVKYFEAFSIPTKQLAIDWIRINFNVDIQVIVNYSSLGKTYRVGIVFINVLKQVDSLFIRPDNDTIHFIEFETPEEAKEVAINHVLTKLI